LKVVKKQDMTYFRADILLRKTTEKSVTYDRTLLIISAEYSALLLRVC